MAEVGQETQPLNPSFVEIDNSITALNNECLSGREDRAKTALKDRDTRIKQRTMNLISVFKHYYKLPEILLIDAGGKDKTREKARIILGYPKPEKEKPQAYLLTSTNQLVSGDFVQGFLGIKKPKINNQQEINIEGQWDYYSVLIQRALVKLVPGLAEKLEDLRHQRLKAEEDKILS